MNDYTKANQERWDELVSIHAQSTFYDLESFKAGHITLQSIEREELGDVSGKALLHLQCHFGQDTLSWARLGAKVTGADFSASAIELVRSLSQELGIEANFICSNNDDLPTVLDGAGQFDIVFTSYGVLCWLPDLQRWGQVIAHFLKPGGVFYIIDGHPIKDIFEYDKALHIVKPTYPYFSSEPIHGEVEGTYTDWSAKVEHTTTYEWNHSMSEILNALISAGLQIDFLHEFPCCHWAQFPGMEQRADGYWHMQEHESLIPLLFSLKATKK